MMDENDWHDLDQSEYQHQDMKTKEDLHNLTTFETSNPQEKMSPRPST